MILKTYTLLDTKVGSYSTPFFCVHQQQALRMVMDVGRDLSTTVGRHPADYALVELGSFNDQTGTFEQTNPTIIGLVAGLIGEQPSQSTLPGV